MKPSTDAGAHARPSRGRAGKLGRYMHGSFLHEDLPIDGLATEHAYDACSRNEHFAQSYGAGVPGSGIGETAS
jgi:hypothetical protein